MVIDTTANLDSTTKLNRRDIIEGCKDWKLWFVLPFNILTSVPPQGFTIFFPLVVKVNTPYVPFRLSIPSRNHKLLPTRGEALTHSDSEGQTFAYADITVRVWDTPGPPQIL